MLKKSEVLQEGYQNGLRTAAKIVESMLLKEDPMITHEMRRERKSGELLEQALAGIESYVVDEFSEGYFNYLGDIFKNPEGHDIEVLLDEEGEEMDGQVYHDFILKYDGNTALITKNYDGNWCAFATLESIYDYLEKTGIAEEWAKSIVEEAGREGELPKKCLYYDVIHNYSLRDFTPGETGLTSSESQETVESFIEEMEGYEGVSKKVYGGEITGICQRLCIFPDYLKEQDIENFCKEHGCEEVDIEEELKKLPLA